MLTKPKGRQHHTYLAEMPEGSLDPAQRYWLEGDTPEAANPRGRDEVVCDLQCESYVA